jgi:cytochrome c peroxidase
MKRTFLLLLPLLVLLLSCEEKKVSPEKKVANILLQQIDTFVTSQNMLLQAVESHAEEKQIQQLFLSTRLAYKKIEWATEYFSPLVSKRVNGAPVIEVERFSGQIFEPAGLQVMEAFLFPHFDTTKQADLIVQVQQLQVQCDKFKLYFTNIDLLDWQLYDASKLALFRIETLGITGFDNPLTLHSMQESSTFLQSLREIWEMYIGDEDTEHLLPKFDNAIHYLDKHPDFNTFNRAEFILQCANPVTIALSQLEKKQEIKRMTYNRLLNQSAQTLFDTNAFNVNAYTPNQASYVTEKKVALGKMLFRDSVLSSNHTRSCQSCHQADKAFTDGLIANTVLNSKKQLPRNTPTLVNAAFQPAQFGDIRTVLLEEQIDSVIHNKDEMHGSLKMAATQLWKKEAYRNLFNEAYPLSHRQGIDTLEIINALASYVRHLVSLNSRFDAYMRGNQKALSWEEIEGFNLFMGKAKCGTCHYMPLFNGAFPPMFMKIETEVLGVPATKNSKQIDSDLGRYAVQKNPALRSSFKTPTVRNTSLTAPYMHNGAFRSLEEVLHFYDEGGGLGRGMDVPNQTLSAEPLRLSQKEQKALIAFLKSLESK